MFFYSHLWNSEARANFLLDSRDFEYDYRKFLRVQLGLSRTFPMNPRVAFFQPQSVKYITEALRISETK